MVDVSLERFEQMVADALDEIPPELGDEMDNVVVVVEDWPTPEQLDGRAAARCSGSTRACRSPSADRSRYAGVAPDRITVFRGPLCAARPRRGRPRASRCGSTVLHEVGHYFGMGDERLDELGWA